VFERLRPKRSPPETAQHQLATERECEGQRGHDLEWNLMLRKTNVFPTARQKRPSFASSLTLSNPAKDGAVTRSHCKNTSTSAINLMCIYFLHVLPY
jgi:hypothetical protein